ncbi:hypothetical protein [Kaistia adipata]|uniref:hypothetical protein n=1 Tax=Kaistia adipata TaxID=166954 RepID=UPI00041253DF|nr:hypothetical protein [Kaistia adipata]
MKQEERRQIIIFGLGAMGRKIATLVLKRGYVIAGAIDFNPQSVGKTLSELLGPDAPACDVRVSNDAEAVLASIRHGVVLQATASFLASVEPAIQQCAAHGHDVISIAEEMSCPSAADPAAALRLDEAARRHGVRIMGTGVNPGFAMDMLVLALTVPCGHVSHIRAVRRNSLSAFGPTVLTSQGVGLSPEAFEAAVADGSVVGHVGFLQSVALIARHLNWTIDRLEETRAPILATARRETPHVTVEPGQVAGCVHCITAFSDGREVLRLEHPQQICPETEGLQTSDEIVITGDQVIRMTITPEIKGGDGTAAAAVNAIEYLSAAQPGLLAVTDLPVNSPRHFAS